MERAELERTLRTLGDEAAYPPTPGIAASVGTALREAPAAGRPVRLPLRRAVAIALLGALVIAAGVVAAVPSVRDALLDLIDLRGATIETTTATAPPPDGGRPRLGRATTLGDARGQLGFVPALPSILGPPDRVFVRRAVPGGELAAVYGNVVLTEFRGDLLPGYVAKLIPAATDVDRLRIRGEEAVWISGAPHFFAYRSPQGVIEESGARTAADVLLVEHGRLLVRIEGPSSRARAVAIARSLR